LARYVGRRTSARSGREFGRDAVGLEYAGGFFDFGESCVPPAAARRVIDQKSAMNVFKHRKLPG
jgi:hypothetical protein